MRAREPLLWALFGAGGMLAALFLPALVLVLYVAAPLGVAGSLARGALLPALGHPLARGFAFLLISLGLFHWAHRFRFTLFDGLQLYHLRLPISAATYGAATLLTGLAAAALLL